jgi:hypothetical protein
LPASEARRRVVRHYVGASWLDVLRHRTVGRIAAWSTRCR